MSKKPSYPEIQRRIYELEHELGIGQDADVVERYRVFVVDAKDNSNIRQEDVELLGEWSDEDKRLMIEGRLKPGEAIDQAVRIP